MSHRVFISYSMQDATAATAVRDALEAAGVACWMAPRDIPPGATWAAAIMTGINAAEMVVLVFSSGSNGSDQVRREIDRANSRRLPVLTVRIEDLLPSGEMEYYLATSQWFDAHDGPLEVYLPRLVAAVQSPEIARQTFTHAPAAPQFDPAAESRAIEDLNWRLAELEQHPAEIRPQQIDKVFESALSHGAPLFAAGETAACGRIYRHTAAGVHKSLTAAGPVAAAAWPLEITALQDALAGALAQPEPEGAAEREVSVAALHQVLLGFVDRAGVETGRSGARPLTWMWGVTLASIALVSVFGAYAHSSMTWELGYAYPFGDPVSTPRAGPYLEALRPLVLMLMAIYVLETSFRPEYERLLLRWGRLSWRAPLVAVFRVLGLAAALALAWSVTAYHLHAAPENLRAEAAELLQEQQQDPPLHQYTAAQVAALQAETEPGFAGHHFVYAWYLPYSLVNYVGFGMTMLAVTLFSVAGDARRLVEERAALYQTLANQRLKDADIDRAYSKFFNVCIGHTQRYLTLLAWISGAVAFEMMVSRSTLTEAGLIYEFLASTVVGVATLVWIGVLIHFYEGAFQRCCAEKRRRRLLTDQWEESRRTVKFLTRCFLNHSGGIFASLYAVPFLINLVRWTAA